MKQRNENGTVVLENDRVRMTYNLTSGRYSIFDVARGIDLVADASTVVDATESTAANATRTCEFLNISDDLGVGVTARIVSGAPGSVSLILDLSVYTGKPFLVLNCGVINHTNRDIRVKMIRPLEGMAFPNRAYPNFKILDGESRTYFTRVTNDSAKSCLNNIFALFGESGAWNCMVLGGLTYHDFEKSARISKTSHGLRVAVWAEDPVGRLVAPGEIYLPDDKYYLDGVTNNPFLSLEQYGLAVRAAQKIVDQSVSYLVINHWYAAGEPFGKMELRNNSAGTVVSMDEARRIGFEKYEKVAVRLEPDDYSMPNNQQGWWDDEHFARYGSGGLVQPFATLRQWGKAILERGGIPYLYCQSGRRSEDYAVEYPNHMLFNDSFAKRSKGNEGWWDETQERSYWGYDYTDPEFLSHMREVYGRYAAAGVRGLKFDYPDTNWCFDGGFEDRTATAAYAYRKMYEAARQGLGASADIQERIGRGDLAAGVANTKRIVPDIDDMYPSTVAPNALRWYKNRVLFNIDTDAKNPNKAFPNTIDGVRAMFTMAYVVSGRLELGVYLTALNRQRYHALSRIFPFHKQPKSARPVDAFCGKKCPEIYDFEINPEWHQIVFFNTGLDEGKEWVNDKWVEEADVARLHPVSAILRCVLCGDQVEGGLGLDSKKRYYVFDFWNDALLGVYNGYDVLEQDLRAGEARVMSIHAVEQNPQFLSTNRHIMQGYVDMLRYPEWDGERMELRGTSRVVGGETYVVVIACNGFTPLSCGVNVPALVQVKERNKEPGIIEMAIDSVANDLVEWTIRFSNNS